MKCIIMLSSVDGNFEPINSMTVQISYESKHQLDNIIRDHFLKLSGKTAKRIVYVGGGRYKFYNQNDTLIGTGNQCR